MTIRKKPGTKKVLISLTPSIFESLIKGAKNLDLTHSAFVRFAILEKFKRIEREKFYEGLGPKQD